MKYLFIHQNFPGQFRHIAPLLAANPDNLVIGVGDAENIKGRPQLHPQLRVLGYKHEAKPNPQTHFYLREHENHIRRGQSVARMLLQLREKGFVPDLIVAHPAWGEAMFIKDVYPEAPLVNYFEYYYHGSGGDVGFDPENPSNIDDKLRVRIKNSTQLQALVNCERGISPTHWQKSRYPTEFQSKIEVIHEGVNTQLLKPDPSAWIETHGHRFQAGDEVVTYLARNLEPYRGFHTFMNTLPKLQAARPNAHVLIIGGDGVSYGKQLPEGKTYRQHFCELLKDQVDWSKVHFLGQLPYNDYVRVLQISAAHIYLTYPFVLSWSMLESMAIGVPLIASATTPVQEVIEHGRNGLLVDFFDTDGLARQIAEVLENPPAYQEMRRQARETVIQRYDLTSICLPKMVDFLHQLSGQ